MDKITREDIAKSISKEFGISYTLSYKKIDKIIKIWFNFLSSSSLTISGLGSFTIKNKSSRIGRNPKSKEEFIISARKTISFKKSKNLNIP